MKTRFYVCGLGYDKNLEAIDYEVDFGDFDTYGEAYELFVKLQCRNTESFFVNASEVYEIDIRVEECEENEDEIECIDIRNEWGIINPSFKEETHMGIKQIAYEKYKLDWMMRNGYSLSDLIRKVGEYMELEKVTRTTLTMKETAEYLGVSYWLVTQLVKRKKIPCSRVGGKVLFRKEALDNYLQKQEDASINS